MISNWDERLRPLLGSIRVPDERGRTRTMTDFFGEAIVVSHEVGATKPALEIFRHASRRLDVPAGSILHVGDSWREDVEGARGAGMTALHLIRARPGARAISEAGVIAGLEAIGLLLESAGTDST